MYTPMHLLRMAEKRARYALEDVHEIASIKRCAKNGISA
jgi:hypothetical protein